MPGAYLFARYRFRGRRVLWALTIVPFVLPTVVVGAAFLALLGPRSPFGLRLEHTIWAILLAHVFYNYAVVLRIVGGFWAQLDPRLETAARMLGASPWAAFRHVDAAAASAGHRVGGVDRVPVHASRRSASSCSLGGPQFATLEVEIYRQTAQLLDLRAAATLALVQLVALCALLLVYSRYQQSAAVRGRLLVGRWQGKPVRDGRSSESSWPSTLCSSARCSACRCW